MPFRSRTDRCGSAEGSAALSSGAQHQARHPRSHLAGPAGGKRSQPSKSERSRLLSAGLRTSTAPGRALPRPVVPLSPSPYLASLTAHRGDICSSARDGKGRLGGATLKVPTSASAASYKPRASVQPLP